MPTKVCIHVFCSSKQRHGWCAFPHHDDTSAVVAFLDKGEHLLDLKGVTTLPDVVLWGDGIRVGASSCTDWLQQGKPAFDPVPRQPGDLAAICHTSGTTGFPKGTMQSHRSVIYAAIGTGVMAARSSRFRARFNSRRMYRRRQPAKSCAAAYKISTAAAVKTCCRTNANTSSNAPAAIRSLWPASGASQKVFGPGAAANTA